MGDLSRTTGLKTLRTKGIPIDHGLFLGPRRHIGRPWGESEIVTDPGAAIATRPLWQLPGPLRPAMRPGGFRRPQGVTAMADFVKIGSTYLNIDRAWVIEDLAAVERVDELVVRFGNGEGEARTFTGREADDLRTWLNSQAANLRQVTGSDLPTEGRAF